MSENDWREIVSGKKDFLHILKLLVDFDEKTGLARKYDAPSAHYMRYAIAVAKPEEIRIFLKKLKDFVFVLAVEYRAPAGTVICTYVHEDGIRAERETRPGDHPVQSIVCMTDLYEASIRAVNISALNAVTQSLMSLSPEG